MDLMDIEELKGFYGLYGGQRLEIIAKNTQRLNCYGKAMTQVI